jgi:hypothetical protein
MLTDTHTNKHREVCTSTIKKTKEIQPNLLSKKKTMGNKQNREFFSKLPETCYNNLQLRYTIVRSNAELTIGNRELLEIRIKEEKNGWGRHRMEKGRLILETKYTLDRETVKQLFESVFHANGFFALDRKGNTNRKMAAMTNTRGSDAGRTIILECSSPSFRKEVKHTEQRKLNAKALESFENIEKDLQAFNESKISSSYVPIQLSLDPSVMNYFMGSKTTNPTPFCISFGTEDSSSKHRLLIYMTGAANEDATEPLDIDTIWLPSGKTFTLYVSPYSPMDDEDEEEEEPEKQAKPAALETENVLSLKVGPIPKEQKQTIVLTASQTTEEEPRRTILTYSIQ